MTITDIKIRKVFDNDGPMKAIASVTFDGALAVHDVKVIYARSHDHIHAAAQYAHRRASPREKVNSVLRGF